MSDNTLVYPQYVVTFELPKGPYTFPAAGVAGLPPGMPLPVPSVPVEVPPSPEEAAQGVVDAALAGVGVPATMTVDIVPGAEQWPYGILSFQLGLCYVVDLSTVVDAAVPARVADAIANDDAVMVTHRLRGSDMVYFRLAGDVEGGGRGAAPSLTPLCVCSCV